MAIVFQNNQFTLSTKSTDYIFAVNREKYLIHLYWGKKLEYTCDLTPFADEFVYPRPTAAHACVEPQSRYYIEDFALEFSTVGSGDYRTPALSLKHENGSPVAEFQYVGYKIYRGKKALPGLPSVYCVTEDNVHTLELYLEDKLTGLEVTLLYSVFEDYDIITRSVKYHNSGNLPIELCGVYSAILDINKTDAVALDLYGSWANERNVEWKEIGHSKISFDSKRGMSSHNHNPFIAVADKNISEDYGEVYAMSLVYSGSFDAFTEGSTLGGTRMGIGINPFGFSWQIERGQEFYAPEAVLVYSNEGLDNMSRIYHRIYRERLCRGIHRDKVRPMIINHWEATGMDFDENKLYDIAKAGAEIGLEVFVIDDGWFRKGTTDTDSLGDWTLNKNKFPSGLKAFAERVEKLGMQLGLWIEPEMVSPDSELYRKHPDWCIHAAGRFRTECRNQLVLDLSRKDVRDYIVDKMISVISSADISYIKWDCNRNLTETSRGSQPHEFVLGLYEIIDRITGKFPHILFESCSGGGGRFDPGMLYYMPQVWTSDNTEPMSRLKIQYGTSFVYPPVTMAAHIGKIEVGFNKENAYMNTSALVAMSGNFGFEFDLTKLSEKEITQAKSYIELYKKIRDTVQFGDMHRLRSTFKNHETAFMFVNKDKTQAVLFTYQLCSHINGEKLLLKLKGLAPEGVYECNGVRYTGEILEKRGFCLSLEVYNYASKCFVFSRTE